MALMQLDSWERITLAMISATATKPHPSHYDVSGVCKVWLWQRCHCIMCEIVPGSPSNFSPKLPDKIRNGEPGNDTRTRLSSQHTSNRNMKLVHTLCCYDNDMKCVEAHMSIICPFWSYHCRSNRNILLFY